MADLLAQLHRMKQQRPQLAALGVEKRNQILKDLARLLLKHRKEILAANKEDLGLLKRAEMKERLLLSEKKIKEMARGLLDVAKQPDPLRRLLEKRVLPNGLLLEKQSVALGTVAVIYEARPNVTVDLAGLAIKSGNAVVLKGGSEACQTNKVLINIIGKVLRRHRLPVDVVYLIKPEDDWQKVLLTAHSLVDVIIPRGGEGLIKWVRGNSQVPIIETGAGVCHTFVDGDVNIKQAIQIIVNAKTQRPSVCNALDTLVVHHRTSKKLLSALAAPLAKWRVEIFADADAYRVLKDIYPAELLGKAKPEHYGREFLSLKMAIKTVKNFEQGLEFVKQKTSGHSEAILSNNHKHISQFLNEVDAAVVYSNASTRFTDGGEFGLGAEVGISTQKLHTRGPMGLGALTSYKWVVKGKGQVRR